jgi:hypothetical protein
MVCTWNTKESMKKEKESNVITVKKVYFKTFTLTVKQVGASQIFEIGPPQKDKI